MEMSVVRNKELRPWVQPEDELKNLWPRFFLEREKVRQLL